MRTVHVIAGLEKSDGGPFYTLPYLWNEFTEMGVQVSVHTTDLKPSNETQRPWKLCKSPRTFPQSLKYSSILKTALYAEMGVTDLCHNHGCWLYPNWAAASTARKAHKPLVISPLGHLDPWSLQHHGWRKQFIRFFVEETNWKYCSAFVAKSEMEADHLQQLGLKQPIRVIPNGIDIHEWERPSSPDPFYEKFPELRNHRLLLFLSRIHQKKGLPVLFQAWAEIMNRFPDWHLVIAGNTHHVYGEKLKSAIIREPFNQRITFTDQLDGPLKFSALAASSLFVLPSITENFGQAILEALASGLPVITTKGCPWSSIEKHECGWWIELDPSLLAKTLTLAMKLSPKELQERGFKGRQWVLRDFHWRKIAEQHCNLYREILDK